jgi:hypothetical protein
MKLKLDYLGTACSFGPLFIACAFQVYVPYLGITFWEERGISKIN